MPDRPSRCGGRGRGDPDVGCCSVTDTISAIYLRCRRPRSAKTCPRTLPPKSLTRRWLDPRGTSGLAASSRALLARWSKTGCKAGLRFCRPRTRFEDAFCSGTGQITVRSCLPVLGQPQAKPERRADPTLPGSATTCRKPPPKPGQAGSRAAILVLKTPQVPIYSLELRRFEGPRNGATPH